MKTLEVQVGDTTVEVSHGGDHPEHYLWIRVAGGALCFLGVLTPGMTRGDVKRMALAHPQVAGRTGSHATN
jgi:hypothetical protein